MRLLPPGTRPSALRALSRGAFALAMGLGILTAGCEDGTEPGALPFGRTGLVRVTVEAPYAPQPSFKRQSITWRSDGRWQLVEGIYYNGRLGDETVRKSSEDPGSLAQRYVTWVTSVNSAASGFQLYPADDVPASVVPSCKESTVTVQIIDTQKADSIRVDALLGDGTLGILTAVAADSLPGAARVIQAATLVRDATLPFDREFRLSGYAYSQTRPFGTIERGELTRTPLVLPRTIQDATTWGRFWNHYISASKPLPTVDFTKEIVFVGAVGTRAEAGDSLEIRAIIPVEFGTQVNMQEQRLGDFCTPGPLEHTPFHIVVAPTESLPLPILFALQERVELVPCG